MSTMQATMADTGSAAQPRAARYWPLLCVLPGLWALTARPVLPLDELRYLSVAWEMWRDGQFLVPHLNGLPYSHKPPLLFWLIHAGWALFGVNEWWPRMLGPAASVVAAGLAQRLARDLWPGDARAASAAPWLLAGSLGWTVFGQMLMYDMLLTVFVLVGLLGVWRASRPTAPPTAFALVALGVCGGVLAKGPVALLNVLVPGLIAPWWAPHLRSRVLRWYALILASGATGLLGAGLWALPAAAAGGEQYAAAILWGQTAGRLRSSFSHARAWYAYLVFLPAMSLPWIAWPPLWRRSDPGNPRDAGMNFVVGWTASVTLALSMISAKQPHYALPTLAGLALLFARRSSRVARDPGPPVRIATASVAVLLAGATAFFVTRGAGFDLEEPARAVAELQAAGAEVAVRDAYKGQLGFLGRIERPFPTVPDRELARWAKGHPGGFLVDFHDHAPKGVSLQLHARYPYRYERMSIWRVPDGAGATDAGS